MDLHIRIAVREQADLPVGYSLYQYGDDLQVYGMLRGCAYGSGDNTSGCPAVQTLKNDYDTEFTEQWQYFLYACNLGMSLGAIVSLMGDEKALMNKTGLREDDP